jgi:hypothetical protein
MLGVLNSYQRLRRRQQIPKIFFGVDNSLHVPMDISLLLLTIFFSLLDLLYLTTR